MYCTKVLQAKSLLAHAIESWLMTEMKEKGPSIATVRKGIIGPKESGLHFQQLFNVHSAACDIHGVYIVLRALAC